MTSRPLLLTIVSAVTVACTGSTGDRVVSAAGLATVFDSTGDSIVARVEGEVPAASLRRLVEELRVAPAVDDTSLFTDVSEFEIDVANRLWIYDRPGNRIFLFGPDGKLVRRVGRQGAGPGEFGSNNGMIALPDSGIALWDARNARVSFFSASGDFRASWRTPAGFFTSNGLVTDQSGAFYLRRPVTVPRESDILGRMGLVRLPGDGQLGDSLVPPDIQVERQIFMAEQRSSKGGVSRSATGAPYAPSSFWQWHPDRYFVAAHGGKYEIILARQDVKAIVIRRAASPVPISSGERAEEEERILWQMRQTDPSWSFAGASLPDQKAPMQQLFVARDGRIWARVATASEPIPDDELDERREKGPPVRHFRSPTVWEVFGPDGSFLGRVPMAWRTTLMEADGDYLWAIVRDEDDLPSVVRYRIEPGLGAPAEVVRAR
jgi:hypothetical protein